MLYYKCYHRQKSIENVGGGVKPLKTWWVRVVLRH